MNLESAMNIFEFNNINELTDESIKKRYRKLIVKYHPDNNNGDIKASQNLNEAKTLLINTLESLKRALKINNISNGIQTREILRTILPFKKVEELYNGGSVTIGKGEEAQTIKMVNLVRDEIYILFEYSISYNNITDNNSEILEAAPNSIRQYKLYSNIYVNDLKPVEVEIKFEGERKRYTISSQSLNIPFVMKSGAIVNIQVTKKIKVDKKEE